jgi:hypothetical protein
MKGNKMQYNTARFNNHRTDSYRFTITSKDDPNLAELRFDIKKHNKWLKRYLLEGMIEDRKVARAFFDHTFKTVKLQGRGPRVINNKLVHPGCFHSLRHKYATSFAVYVEDDWSYTRMYYSFLETGITVTEQQKQQRADHAAFIAKMNAQSNRNNIFVNQLNKLK